MHAKVQASVWLHVPGTWQAQKKAQIDVSNAMCTWTLLTKHSDALHLLRLNVELPACEDVRAVMPNILDYER